MLTQWWFLLVDSFLLYLRSRLFGKVSRSIISRKSMWRQVSKIKGSLTRDFRSQFFFHESVSPRPQSIPLGPFWIFSKIRGDIHEFMFITGVNDTDVKLFSGVNDTGEKFIAGVPRHGFSAQTSVIIGGVVDRWTIYRRCRWYRSEITKRPKIYRRCQRHRRKTDHRCQRHRR